MSVIFSFNTHSDTFHYPDELVLAWRGWEHQQRVGADCCQAPAWHMLCQKMSVGKEKLLCEKLCPRLIGKLVCASVSSNTEVEWLAQSQEWDSLTCVFVSRKQGLSVCSHFHRVPLRHIQPAGLIAGNWCSGASQNCFLLYEHFWQFIKFIKL